MISTIKHSNPSSILPVIVISQVAGTSLWFAGNAVMASLQAELQLPLSALGHITSAVQIGFIIGTLAFAILTIADRFSPSKVFFGCALLGAAANLGVLLAEGFISLLLLRLLTGFFLAGIYPVGMKIAADWHEKGLGKALGYLVGALVLGTASPHLLKALGESLPWQGIFVATSGFALLGGMLMLLFVPDGPYRRRSQGFDPKSLLRVFSNRSFRAAAFGYFGHMWELYTFWAFVPLLLMAYEQQQENLLPGISLLSFAIIAIGALACIWGGYLSQTIGSGRVAFRALLVSLCCCLLSPLLFYAPPPLFLVFLLLWGMAVVADSPQFSALVAQNAPKEATGTALTIVNCLGFSITIFSIQLMNLLSTWIAAEYRFMLLAIGPLLGLFALKRGIKF
ncbi:MFS transporter [Cesiribacter sp. SM1]|uniref:MFS transporter n=1 Tax=Cesiribacter sp. SM1 TaxID=2861196 RepID=UPI001CD72C33|nr:MFS transporter [Cesiribacter sp. SM1]